MASNLIQRPRIFQDENLDLYCKKAVTGEKSKSSKQSVVKKAATGLKSRGALNDITNKSSVPPKASQKKSVSQKKKLLVKEDAVNIAEETFLHDHQKCIEAKQAARTVDLLDLVFPGDSLSSIEIADMKPEKSNHHYLDSRCCFPEPEELPMEEFSTWFQSPTWKSPQSSPARSDSSLSLWEFEPVEFKLKEDMISRFDW